jgi:glutaredoxin
VTTTSRVNEIALAKHLRKIGAKLYTAYWCPHCHHQKQRFGKEAVKHLEVIECDQRGVNPQTQLCRNKKVRAFPTWDINGKLYPGNHSLESIANFSKYRGNL